MNVDQLNSRFGAPGRIVFHQGFAGYPNVVIANQYGSAEVALLGGNVLSYRPTGQAEVLFRPAKRDYNRADRVHCGIPVCWPQFGNRFSKDLPQHGFVRSLVFEVRASEYSEEKTEVTLGLKSDAETKRLWNHDFDLELKVTVSMKLNLSLVVKNTGSEPFAFNGGFHPYFLVRDRDGVTVKGLDGCAYVDAAAKDLREGVWSGDLIVDRSYDHVFSMPPAPKHEYALLDAGLRRAIAIATSGNAKTVVWNPGETSAVADHGAGDWKKFVCVEPVTEWPGGEPLAPGKTFELLAAIQSHLDM